MKVIWKFELDPDINGRCAVLAPRILDFLSVGAQGDRVVMWAAVDTGSGLERQEFAVVGTGWEFPEGTYRGTVQVPGGYVWHVVELVSELRGEHNHE